MGIGEFQSILASQSDYLRPFAITLTRDSEVAKDLLQETMYRAIANRDKYNVGTNIKAWLYTIMRNIFINDYRRQLKRRAIFDSTANEYFLEVRQPAGTPTIEGTLHAKEILAAVHRMPEIFRNPFQLYFDGFRYHEIARMLKEPLGTIKSRIHFARKLLKAEIDRY